MVGGVRHGRLTFDRRVAGMNASMLALAVIGLGLPTAFAAARGGGPDVQTISDVTAAILVVLYVLSLIFYFRAGPGRPASGEPALAGGLAIGVLLLSTARWP